MLCHLWKLLLKVGHPSSIVYKMLLNMEYQVELLEILNLQRFLCLLKLLSKLMIKDRRYMYGGQIYWPANNIGQNGLKV